MTTTHHHDCPYQCHTFADADSRCIGCNEAAERDAAEAAAERAEQADADRVWESAGW